ncbi:MAG: hypothetical protein MUC93_09455 [Bacteroidales bacterium]|jgi:hypothetical protein|nr:hypothetical protein [Bacteroidales bacterium]
MEQDTIFYDSLVSRPLPKWLTDQRDGLNTVQIVMPEIKEDRSLEISFVITGAIVLLVITFLTLHVIRKNKNQL